MGSRPSIEEVEQKGLVNSTVSPAIQENMKKLEKEMKRDSLSRSLSNHIIFFILFKEKDFMK